MAVEILIVDDSAVQAATRKAILEKCSRSVQTANSANQALELLSHPEMDGTLRLLITDHHMPGMNGPEFVTVLRRRAISIPVLVLSGRPDAEFEYEGLNVIFRLKPFLPSALIKLAQSLLDEDEPMGRTA